MCVSGRKDKENLFKNQELLQLLIISFDLVTLMCVSGRGGDIIRRNWMLVTLKGLKLTTVPFVDSADLFQVSFILMISR